MSIPWDQPGADPYQDLLAAMRALDEEYTYPAPWQEAYFREFSHSLAYGQGLALEHGRKGTVVYAVGGPNDPSVRSVRDELPKHEWRGAESWFELVDEYKELGLHAQEACPAPWLNWLAFVTEAVS